MNTKKAIELIHMDPPEVIVAIEAMTPDTMFDVRKSLEAVAEWATWLARYVDDRHGCGCGDQGHARALISANRAARTLWCKAFGYNAYVERRPPEPAKGGDPR